MRGRGQDPNVILYHLTSLPGAGETGSLSLLRRALIFWAGESVVWWDSWSVSILSWFFCVNSFLALYLFLIILLLLLFVFLISLLFPIYRSYLSPWSLPCVPLILLSGHLWAEERGQGKQARRVWLWSLSREDTKLGSVSTIPKVQQP